MTLFATPARLRGLLASAVFLGMACVETYAQGAAPQAQTPDLRIRQLASSCANCHGTNGVAVTGSPVVGLAGYDAAAFTAAMVAFKNGTRPATIMHQISKGYTDEQVAQLAAHFASLKK
jgi:cytochrome subunit of sulfide dehydrogenase